MRQQVIDDASVGPHFHRLRFTGSQPLQGEGGSSALEDHQVSRGGRDVGQDDQASPVMAASADRGDEPLVGLVESGPASGLGHPRSSLPVTEHQVCVNGGRVEFEDPVGQALQHDGPPDHARRLADDLLGGGALQRHLGERAVHRLGRLQLLHLGVHNVPVDRGGETHERCVPAEHDQRELPLVRDQSQAARQLAVSEPVA